MAEYAHLSTVDPELAPLLVNLPPYEKVSAQTRRERFETVAIAVVKKNAEPFLPSAEEYKAEDRYIDVGDGIKVLAKCVTPVPKRGEEERFPLLFWIHGGGRLEGWILGNADMDDYTMRTISVNVRVSVVNCEYRLAPENPFPAAVDDTFAALKYVCIPLLLPLSFTQLVQVASHPEEFSADLKKGFIVAGASAGGNLSAVLSHLAREDPFFKDKPITGQHLQVPLVCHPKAYPEKCTWDIAADVYDMIDFYNPPPEDLRFSPLLLPSHKGLPPAFVQVSGLDPLRDEGILYEKVLREAGVPTKLEIYPGTVHGFNAFYPTIGQAAKWRNDHEAGLRWLLEQK
ncbi:hypothetical protein VNI00_011781 [Paramarasmius palmivorus]|uniref:Alpha/beta hydrolase fold-3 domain-containing protein n=1 Tax=Paramarasmius palmivorus TaxID=297713 RepID=A0AAW0CAX0_9AGAR